MNADNLQKTSQLYTSKTKERSVIVDELLHNIFSYVSPFSE